MKKKKFKKKIKKNNNNKKKTDDLKIDREESKTQLVCLYAFVFVIVASHFSNMYRQKKKLMKDIIYIVKFILFRSIQTLKGLINTSKILKIILKVLKLKVKNILMIQQYNIVHHQNDQLEQQNQQLNVMYYIYHQVKYFLW